MVRDILLSLGETGLEITLCSGKTVKSLQFDYKPESEWPTWAEFLETISKIWGSMM